VYRVALTILTAAFSLAIGEPAFAADFEPPPVYQVAPPVVVAPAPVPVYNWTGIYFGFNGGYGFGQHTPMSLYGDDFSAFNYAANGFLAGLTAGAQIQNGHTIMGIEADIDWANMNGSGRGTISFNGASIGTATLSSSLSSISTLRSRIGYASDNWLFFLSGGLAVTNETSNLTGAVGFICGTGAASSPPCSSLSNLHLGLAAGAGLEYGITPNLSAKGEYIWIGAGALNTLKENMLRVGVNWRFGM
jgi:outer membrane immunogenic protein